MDVERFSGKVIALAEDENDSDVLKAKFLICDFGDNHNKVRINRNTIDQWVSTLVNKPFVGKVVTVARNTYDFSGHCMRLVKRIANNGEVYNDVEFDTSAFGTFTSAQIEEVDGVECITADCTLWKRYHQSCEIVQKRFAEGTLHTSWEIEVLDSSIDNGIKVINDGRFIGHCALGSNVPPAYDSSRLLEVASAEEEDEIVSALAEDSVSIFGASSDIDDSNGKEDLEMPKNVIVNETEFAEKDEQDLEQSEVSEVDEAEVTENPEVSESEEVKEEENEEGAECKKNKKECSEESEPEVSSLTMRDIMSKLRREIWKVPGDCDLAYCFPEDNVVWVHDYSANELTFISYKYEVVEDQVTLSDPQEINLALNVHQINEYVAQTNQQIAELNAQVEELKPYKEASEAAERETKIAEMRKFAMDSKRFTEEEMATDEMNTMFNTLDYASLNAMIAQRTVADNRQVVSSAKEVEKSEVADLTNGATELQGNQLHAIRSWLFR